MLVTISYHSGMENLILYFGGRQKTADALGVKPSYISMCRNNKRKLGIDKILLAIQLTGGKFSVEQLRANSAPTFTETKHGH